MLAKQYSHPCPKLKFWVKSIALLDIHSIICSRKSFIAVFEISIKDIQVFALVINQNNFHDGYIAGHIHVMQNLVNKL